VVKLFLFLTRLLGITFINDAYYILFVGGVQILPTIAYLITNVLKELGETNSSSETSKNKISILAALDAFHVLCKHSFGYHKVSESKWRSLLQSTIAKLIDISKTGNYMIK